MFRLFHKLRSSRVDHVVLAWRRRLRCTDGGRTEGVTCVMSLRFRELPMWRKIQILRRLRRASSLSLESALRLAQHSNCKNCLLSTVGILTSQLLIFWHFSYSKHAVAVHAAAILGFMHLPASQGHLPALLFRNLSFQYDCPLKIDGNSHT